MPHSSAVTPDRFNTFGELLKFLRRRAGLTQRELSIAVGYSESQISRLEQTQRPPDAASVLARFVPALGLETDRDWVERLLKLATAARSAAEPEEPAALAETPSGLLTGTVTFLFTDIEGSTQLWQRHREAMPAALARHHAILKDAISTHGGHVFQIVGDGFCSAFATPVAGVGAALAAQRALRDEPWGETGPIRARVALHCGSAPLQPGNMLAGGYGSGITLSRVARLLSAAHGGQILLSQVVSDLLLDQLPDGISLHDLGEYRLKGLVRPEHIFQVVVSDLAAEFPPLASPGASRNNLPIQLTSFIGREREIADIKRLLATTRLLTLAGSGGVGKTRLSLRAAEEVVDDFADGVWFTELAPLTDPALMAQAVAVSLRLRDEPGRPVLDSLIDYLRTRQALLVLDNCEHLLVACAQLADSLLRTCPRLQILASSREPLGIAGEAVLAVPSLPFPAAGRSLNAERLAEYAAVRLFADRARLVMADYEAAPNSPAIASICQRLDGIPLAIEMAAARVNLLSTAQLAERLDDAFRLLTGGSRTALPRQQTLRATMDWSYDLLSEPERVLLHRLSVFAGGWTLEAAESVCAGDGVQKYEVLDLLAQLASKSLVGVEEQAGAARYSMLETMRQYAREKLQEAGETTRLHARHRDYFWSFAETNFPKLQTKELPAWIPKLEAEQDNLRQALEWCFSDLTDVEAGPRLVIAMLSNVWASQFLYPFHEQLEWCNRGVALCQSHPDIPARLHVKLLEYAASFMVLDDPQTALAWSKQAVEISRGLGPEGKEALMWNLFHLAQFFLDVSEIDQAVAPIAESESILQELGPIHYAPDEGLRVKAYFAVLRADLANRQGRYLEAKQHAGESIRLYEESGSRWFAKGGYTNIGTACLNLGEYQEAREHFLAALSINHEMHGSDAFNGDVLRWLAMVDARQGLVERALEYCQDSLQQADRIPDRNIIASDLGLMAVIRAQQGQPIRAARLAGASAALYARQKRKPWEDSSLDTLLPGWRQGPDQAAIQQAFEAGRAMQADQMVAYALGGADI